MLKKAEELSPKSVLRLGANPRAMFRKLLLLFLYIPLLIHVHIVVILKRLLKRPSMLSKHFKRLPKTHYLKRQTLICKCITHSVANRVLYLISLKTSDFPDTIQIPSGRQEQDPGCAC